MPETAKFTYRAFLSYSHRDHEWGDWVHRRLESWPVPKDLVGQVAVRGDAAAQRVGKAFILRVAGNAVDDDREDTIGSTERLELTNLFVDVRALG